MLNRHKKIGTLIDPSAIDVNLTARQHLSFFSTAANIDKSKVEDMLKITGLEKVKNKKNKVLLFRHETAIRSCNCFDQ